MTKVEDTLRLVKEAFTAADQGRTDRASVWHKLFQHYRGQKVANESDRDGDTDNNYFIPDSFTCVETANPRLCGDFINTNKNILDVMGRTPEDHDKKDKIKSALDWAFDRDKTRQKYAGFTHSACTFGNAVTRVYYDHRTQKKTKWEPVDKTEEQFDGYGNPAPPLITKGYESKATEVVVADNPATEPVSIYDFYMDPEGWDIDSSRFVIQRKAMTREEIMDLVRQKVYKLPEDLPEEGDWLEDSNKADDKSLTNDDQTNSSGLKHKFEILEYWEDDRVVVVCDKKWVFRDEPNPYWCKKKPFVYAGYNCIPFQKFQVGIVESIFDLQQVQNDLANNNLLNIKLINAPVLLHDATIKQETVRKRKPRTTIAINNFDAKNPKISYLVNPPLDLGSAMKLQQDTGLQSQNASGVTDYFAGRVNQDINRQTATEVMSKTNQANNRFVFTFKWLAEQYFTKIAWWFLELMKQFTSEERIIRILGPEGVEFTPITPEDIWGEYDIQIAIDPNDSENEMAKQSLIQLAQMLMAAPQGALVEWGPFIRDLFDKFKLTSSKYVKKQEEINNGGPFGAPGGFGEVPGQQNGGVAGLPQLPSPSAEPYGSAGIGGFGGMPASGRALPQGAA